MGLINYYGDIRRKRSHTLDPLDRLCSTKRKFKWTNVDNNDFKSTKKVLGRDVLIYHPNFSKTFMIHTAAGKTNLGGLIGKDGKPIAFYSRELPPAQTSYLTTER